MTKYRERKDRLGEKNRKTLRKACYQYVIDHAYPTPKGLVVNFYLPQEDEFYRKLEAREYLDYIRVAKEEQMTNYNEWLKEYKRLQKHYKRYEKWYLSNKEYLRLIREVRRTKGIKARFFFWLRDFATKRLNKMIERKEESV